ncbi:MAG TPA: radical SAM protein, partial [Thermoleophilia bacterium]|nr:radical SAM protein [Thermoleophilia bacterium]
MSTTRGLYTAVQRRTINQILKLATSDDKGKIVKAFNLAAKITPETHRGELLFVRDKIIDDHPALNLARHVTHDLSPRARDRFVECFVINTMLRGSAKRNEFTQREGMPTPFTILISPTMRCNLTCDGCFAGEYDRDSDMDIATLQRIVDQANEMGVYLITILGGEPFFREDLLDFYERNPDVYFQIYTNGTLLDDDTLDRLAAMGNIAPMLSIEGDREMTDARRGPGVFDQLMIAMDGLRERGMVFGYSATVTRKNWQMLVGDEFTDLMVAKGAMICWNFLY